MGQSIRENAENITEDALVGNAWERGSGVKGVWPLSSESSEPCIVKQAPWSPGCSWGAVPILGITSQDVRLAVDGDGSQPAGKRREAAPGEEQGRGPGGPLGWRLVHSHGC